MFGDTAALFGERRTPAGGDVARSTEPLRIVLQRYPKRPFKLIFEGVVDGLHVNRFAQGRQRRYTVLRYTTGHDAGVMVQVGSDI